MKRTIILSLLLFFLTYLHCVRLPFENSIEAEESRNIYWDVISGKLAYSRLEGTTGYLFIANGESKKVTLVKKADSVQFADLTWKYDGSLITFMSFDINKNKMQLYNITLDGKTMEQIYPADENCYSPSWSHDGRLAYVRGNSVAHKVEIWIDGNPFFYKANCFKSRPAWSPDGKNMIITITNTSTMGSLYKVYLSDTSFTPLTNAAGNRTTELYSAPIYSPDGAKIAYVKSVFIIGYFADEIWIMNADGTNPQRLTSGHHDFSPTWSPDGKYIAFTRDISDKPYIFAVNVDTRTVVQITQNEGQYPAWIK